MATGQIFADNTISPKKLIAEPTFESIGVELLYNGDANLNSAAKAKPAANRHMPPATTINKPVRAVLQIRYVNISPIS